MAKKVEAYASKEGQLFHTEQQADLADIEKALRASDKPRLFSSISVILEHGVFLAEILAPLAPPPAIPPGESEIPPVRRVA